MAVSPVNVTRISQNMRTSLMLDSLRQNQRDVFLAQTRIASGRSFVTPSEDPVSAARALDLTQALARQKQFAANAQYGDSFLAAADSSLTEINALLVQASMIASQTVGSLTSAAEREATAEVVNAIRQQLQIVGNRQISGRYIFGGRNTTDRPFIDALGGVAYVGDTGELLTRVSEDLTAAFSVPGSLLFGALSDRISSDVNLTPLLAETTRLEDITGAAGREIQTGTLVFNEVGGAGVFTADLSTADTIGDVVTMINEAATAAGARLTASLSDTGLDITPVGAPVSVTDASSGRVAADLGILTNTPTNQAITGRTLIPRITRLTPVDALVGGLGFDTDRGFIIDNGGRTATVDLSVAATVQDIINTINNAGVFVLARINEQGTGIDVFNQVSGTSLSIGENGGTTAADLGIRTFDDATPLDRLNFGNGVSILDGLDDLRIVAKDGSNFGVNLDTAVTIGDVIELINAAAAEAGVNITASFTEIGNGLRLEDATGGAGTLAVTLANLSHAATDLGFFDTSSETDTELFGRDVNRTRTEGIIGALTDLENALRADDTQAISQAGGRLDTLRDEVTRIHGIIGARSQAMQSKQLQLEDAALMSEVFLSEVQDLDYAEAVTRLQETLTRLQANLQTGSVVMNLSLLDFLR